MTSTARQEESAAAHGARWMTVAFLIVGLLNYGYALMLTRLLDVAEYSRFAAGQALILWASTVAAVTVPLPLAQSMARARSDSERAAAIRFAKLAGAGSGVIAAGIVGIIAMRFGGSLTATVVALSTFALFLGTATTGWLLGQQRTRALSILYVGENVLKNLSGLLLVIVAGLRDIGALAAFGIGAMVMLAWWPRTPRRSERTWLGVLANGGLWRRTLRIAAVQAMVSLFVALDVVLVAMLPGNRALAASYQASAALSRVALFVSGAVVSAFFPLLSRQATGGEIAARALRMYAAAALPLSVVLATMPAALLAAVFPAQYGAMATLLKFTAMTGLAAGGIILVTAVFQAADDSSFLPWLGVGLAGYVAALLAGWRIGGVGGLAVGAALGALATLTLMGYRLIRREGRGLLARIPLVEPVAATAVLILLRPYTALWLVAAALVGLRASMHFVRPGARHARAPRWAAPGNRTAEQEPALSVLTDAVWRGTARKPTDADLDQALILARQNRVEGRLARAYPAQLSDVLAQARATAELFMCNMDQVASRLHRAGIPAALITVDSPGDHVSTTIDLVVPEQHWRRALTALADWYVRSSTDQLDHSNMALLSPSAGPGLHLYTSVSWFGVPALPTRRLLNHARTGRRGFLIPAPADYLLIWLAQALFQNLTLDLSKLLAVGNLLHPAVITAARTEASRAGWRSDFDTALAAAHGAIESLDRGLPLNLPVLMPVSQSLGADKAYLHQGHQIGAARPDAQEAALRDLIAVAQMQRMVAE